MAQVENGMVLFVASTASARAVQLQVTPRGDCTPHFNKPIGVFDRGHAKRHHESLRLFGGLGFGGGTVVRWFGRVTCGASVTRGIYYAAHMNSAVTQLSVGFSND